MSLEEEITSDLQNAMKSTPAALEISVNNATEFTNEQIIVTLIPVMRSLQDAAVRLAREIDELRAS